MLEQPFLGGEVNGKGGAGDAPELRPGSFPGSGFSYDVVPGGASVFS